ncbi:MAG TPA: hypothetical protein P5528_10205 [Steroidobacteraceae bacterium]|nr:hypothetical protein [Steroidobacteraceae bacterium]HRX89806.1 hypothetical protein [Steroidobacteraceae bacterium]
MTTYSLWLYFHIMLVVFSLGPDIAVFSASQYAKNTSLSVEARATLMKLGGFLDLFPRTSFALFLPVGMHLARGMDLYPVTPTMLAIAWLITLTWIVMIFVIYRNEGKPLAIRLTMVQTVYQLVIGAVFVAIGLQSLVTGAPLAAGWFALKMLLFGLMFWTAMAVEIAYRPLFIPYLEILQFGSTPERERLFRKYVNRALIGVFVIYLEVAGMAFLGATKPFY